MPIGWHLNAFAMPGLRWNPPFGIFGGHVYRTMAWSAFGVVPFSRHEVCDWWRLFGYPFSVDAEGYREVIKGHSFTERASPV